MTTRMQQRRGTAAQWTAANPILAAGEIGFVTDTNKFKMGNGTLTWSQLEYFSNAAELTAAIQSVVGMAPETLNTLSEISDALGDDPNFLSALVTKTAFDTAALNGASELQAARDYLAGSLSSHTSNSINVHGIADTSALATKAYADAAVSTNNAVTTNIHGIANTSALALTETVNSELALKANIDGPTFTGTVSGITKSMVGLGNVDNTTDAGKPVSAAQESAISTAKTEAITAAGIAADAKVSAHDLDTLNVHGIANTAVLATLTDVTNAVNGSVVDQSTLVGTGLSWNSVDTQFEVDETHITTATQTELDLKAPLANPTFTGTVAGVTKTHVGLGNVDNTADADKPVSTAQASAIATAKDEAIAAVNNVIASAPAALNTLDELAAALGDDANFATTVTNNLAAKAPVANPTFTGTVTVAASGVAFTDGTQTKAGVPSITDFATEITSSATLAAGQADKFVPLNGAVTITLPASGYSTGQSIDFWQSTGTGAQFASTNGVVGTPGYKFRTTNSVVTAMKTSSGWLIFGDLSA
jgi:hypothetical protein